MTKDQLKRSRKSELYPSTSISWGKDHEVLNRARRLAKEQNRTLSSFLRMAVTEYVQSFKEDPK